MPSNGNDGEIIPPEVSSTSNGRPKRTTNGKAPLTKEVVPAGKKARVEDAAVLVAGGNAAAAVAAASTSATQASTTKVEDESGIVRKASNSHGWAVVKASILAYKEINGNLKIPPNFVIPANDARYPPACWNVHLSKLIQNIRYRGFYKQHTDELIEMGMEYKSRSWDNMKSALECYKRLHGHLRINKSYVVPKDDEVNYPDPHVRGMNLGMICKEIRRGKAYKAHFDELFQMGFPYQPQVLAQRELTEEQQQQLPQDVAADIVTKKAAAANTVEVVGNRGRKSDRASKSDKGLVSDATQLAAAVSSSSSSSRGTKLVRGGQPPRVLAEEDDKAEDSDSSTGSASKPLTKPPVVLAVSKRNKGKTKGGQDVLTTLPPAQSNTTTPSSGNSGKSTGAGAGAVSGASGLKRKHSEISRPPSAAAADGAEPSPSEFPHSHSSSSSSSSSSAAFTPACAAAGSQPPSASSTGGSKEPHNSTGWVDRVKPALLAYRQLHGQSSNFSPVIYIFDEYFTCMCSFANY